MLGFNDYSSYYDYKNSLNGLENGKLDFENNN